MSHDGIVSPYCCLSIIKRACIPVQRKNKNAIEISPFSACHLSPLTSQIFPTTSKMTIDTCINTVADKRLSIPLGYKDNSGHGVDIPPESTPFFILNDSTKFAFRVSLALTLGSVFTLAFSAGLDKGYPDAQWVYITAGVVSWQSNPDTGSVFKKAWQRTLGPQSVAC